MFIILGLFFSYIHDDEFESRRLFQLETVNNYRNIELIEHILFVEITSPFETEL